jgi:glycosyltransferase involved in cell wall biosynthesis
MAYAKALTILFIMDMLPCAQSYFVVSDWNVLDFAAVVTGHREGVWLRASIESALKNAQFLEHNSSGTARVYVLLDNPDSITEKIASEFLSVVSLHKLQFGDISQVRNYAVNLIQEEYIAFLDGDDLWAYNWLFECHSFLLKSNHPRLEVLHSNINYQFGGEMIESMVVIEQISSADPRFNLFALSTGNYWSALCCAHKSIFLACPYVSSNYEVGYGFEDWTFNIQTFEKGFIHQVIPETAHFIRRKTAGSRVKHESSMKITHFPSKLWSGNH